MGALPSATMTVLRVVTFAGAFFGIAQNNPTNANTVSTTSTVLFMGGNLGPGFWCRGSICPGYGLQLGRPVEKELFFGHEGQ